MLMIIDLNGATHLAINVPSKDSATMLPSLVSLCENNLTAVEVGWNESKIVKPKITVELTSVFQTSRNETEIVIKTEESIAVSEDFTALTPEVFISAKEALARKETEVTRLRRELDALKLENEGLREDVESLKQYNGN